jgi:hypothetical protein
MKVWAGKEARKRGKEFGEAVAERLRDLGWTAETEVNITKLLRQGFSEDFGDVDVLAWNPRSGRVLIIECKDVQYRKTFGEIAEQLSDFRGELRQNGKPDYLRRHLNRINLVDTHVAKVAQYTGIAALKQVESHLVFKNPVPMQFAARQLSGKVAIHTYDELAAL